MKKYLILLGTLFFINTIKADKYLTKTGKIIFVSKAPLETNIGTNNSVASLINTETGSIDFSVPIKSFVFDKQLMQEHFNENYMESGKYPTSTFKGTITNLNTISFSKDGNYPATVKGVLTIHGVTKDITNSGTIKVKGNSITIETELNVLVADYKISIPGAVADKVSKTVKITINSTLDKMK